MYVHVHVYVYMYVYVCMCVRVYELYPLTPYSTQALHSEVRAVGHAMTGTMQHKTKKEPMADMIVRPTDLTSSPSSPSSA